jgi:uncharacterized protein
MTVMHDSAAHRFRVPLDEGEAYLEYAERGPGTLDLLHTIVPPAAQGGGVGSTLVEHVMRHAREYGLRVIPSCPFVRSWLEEHSEYQDLATNG